MGVTKFDLTPKWLWSSRILAIECEKSSLISLNFCARTIIRPINLCQLVEINFLFKPPDKRSASMSDSATFLKTPVSDTKKDSSVL